MKISDQEEKVKKLIIELNSLAEQYNSKLKEYKEAKIVLSKLKLNKISLEKGHVINIEQVEGRYYFVNNYTLIGNIQMEVIKVTSKSVKFKMLSGNIQNKVTGANVVKGREIRLGNKIVESLIEVSDYKTILEREKNFEDLLDE
jgi:hypothetical protein